MVRAGKDTGVSPCPQSVTQCAEPERLVAVRLEKPGFAPVLLVSVYLHPVVRMSDANRALLAHLLWREVILTWTRLTF